MMDSQNKTSAPVTSGRILKALKAARLRIEQHEKNDSEAIAVIGMGCRFPGGGDTPEKFWKLQLEGADLLQDYPSDRWPVEALCRESSDRSGKISVRKGYFIDNVNAFDAEFFKISPKEARSMDPQHRLVLEVSWQALAAAAISPGSLRGSKTGVFLGMGQNDHARYRLTGNDLSRIRSWDGTGNLSAFASGRLSWLLKVNGPSITIDTACSSSLVAVHYACRSLRNREADLALAGGVHLVLSPEITVFLSRAQALSPDGRCRAFDAEASGFGRGEGCGMIVLKRLSDAVMDGDRIMGVIRGSAVNHDGESSGLTVPSESAQADLLCRALANAGTEPGEISYIEAHGTGTRLGDPIEMNAIGSVFKTARQSADPLIIGTVKSGIGHLEAAAGIAGLIRTVLCLRNRVIPGQLHFHMPSPCIEWEKLPVRIPVKNTPLTKTEGTCKAGVSAFGMSGTNAHIILESYENPEDIKKKDLTGKAVPIRKTVFRADRVIPQEWVSHDVIHAGTRLHLPFSDEIRFEKRISEYFPASMADHRISGRVVVPAAMYVCMVVSAMQTLFPSETVVLESVAFRQALVPESGSIRRVQLCLKPSGENAGGGYTFQIISCDETALTQTAEQTDAWTVHVTGRTCSEVRTAMSRQGRSDSVNSFPENLPPSISGSEFYAELDAAGFQLGESFQWCRDFRDDKGTVMCRLKSYASPGGHSKSVIHPGLVDSCFQTLTRFLDTNRASDDLFVPFQVENLKFYGFQESEKGLWCRAPAGDRLSLMTDNGTPVMELSGFEFRLTGNIKLFRPAGNHLLNHVYETVWHPAVLQTPDKFRFRSKTEWILISDEYQISGGLKHLLRSGGDTCSVVRPAQPEVISEIFENLSEARFSERNIGVVYLPAVNADNETENNDVPASLEKGLLCLLQVLQAFARVKKTGDKRFFLITENARPVHRGETVNILQAPMWEMVGVMANEHSEIQCTCVDVDKADNASACRQIFNTMFLQDGEGRNAFRNGKHYVAGLQRREVSSAKRVVINKSGSYLITGGFGALGVQIAAWLAERGGRNLVLTGRNRPSPETHRKIQRLSSGGVKVRCLRADVSEADDVAGLISKIERDMPPLRGIFHAAGVLNDSILIRQKPEQFREVLAPKVAGAWNLHHLTCNCPLDFFVCFSSVACITGNPGQGAYSAANAFMDGLMHCRRTDGNPGLSISWSGWGGSGMAAGMDANHQRKMAEQGMNFISPDEGLDLMGRLMGEPTFQPVVFPVDRQKYQAKIRHGFLWSFFRADGTEKMNTATSAPGKPDVTARLKKQPLKDRKAFLSNHIRHVAAGVLELRDDSRIRLEKSFFDYGMDSLMAVELKEILEADLRCSFRTTMVFDYPTLSRLTDYVWEKVFSRDTVQEMQEKNVDVDMNLIVSELDAMSEDEVMQQILEKGDGTFEQY